MSEQVEPIRRSVVARCSPERAFHVFTEEMGSWWPAQTHSRAAAEFEEQALEVQRIEFQGRKGGQVLEHMSNGETLPWAEILAWEPPTRFVLAWRPHSRPQAPTEVEVTFTANEAGTLVVLEHRGWDRLPEDIREAYEDYSGGWILTLSRFAEAASKEVA